MNKEMLYVATGVGIGALMFTDQGKKLVQATMAGSFLPALEGNKDGGNKGDSEAKGMKSEKDDDEFFGRKNKEKEEE